MYSSAIFERRDMPLEEASRAKLDRICDKLDLQPSDHVLEIGTGLGRVRAARRRDPRLPRDDHDPVARAARTGAGAGARGRPRGPRDDPARRLPRADRHLRQARLDRDDRGRRLEGLRDLLRALRVAAAPGRRDGAAGDHDRRPALRRREGPALVHELADLPERLPAVGRGDRAQRRPPQRPADGRSRGHHAALRGDAAALAGERRGARGRGWRRWATTSASSGCGRCT